jgi:2-C-methyl-D-erythritol 4-phosphate cytidylyltransferase
MQSLAILVAAGRGERMGAGRPKAFLELAGEALVLRAARAFDEAPAVVGIVAVVPEAEVGAARALLAPVRKLLAVVPGGERRQDSVLEGLKQAPEGWDGVVLVHDAARPLVDVALVEAVARAAAESGAALPVLPVVDTVKRLRDGLVVETLDRDELGAAQTPQGFRLALLVEAYEAAFRDRLTVTDEAMAVERLGAPVRALPGSPRNRKVTTPEDLAWAEGCLGARPRMSACASGRASTPTAWWPAALSASVAWRCRTAAASRATPTATASCTPSATPFSGRRARATWDATFRAGTSAGAAWQAGSSWRRSAGW